MATCNWSTGQGESHSFEIGVSTAQTIIFVKINGSDLNLHVHIYIVQVASLSYTFDKHFVGNKIIITWVHQLNLTSTEHKNKNR